MTRPVLTGRSHHHSRRRGTRLALLLLPVLLGSLLSARTFAQPARSRPLYTNQPKFRIPFEYDAEEMARLHAVKIQLFVSTNQGRDWKLAQSVVPSEAKFTFEATEDGEHWFAVRTLDANNQRHPAEPLQPGLRVVIDRTRPELEIGLRETSAGEVKLTWSADDPALDVDSLKLEFLNPGAAEWQPVAITPMADGSTTWSVSHSGRVVVRGSIGDLAGNVASTEAAVELGRARPATPTGAGTIPQPDFSKPVAESPVESDLASSPAPITEPPAVRSSFPESEKPLIHPVPADRNQLPQIVSSPARAPAPPADPFGSIADPTADIAEPTAGIPQQSDISEPFADIARPLDDIAESTGGIPEPTTDPAEAFADNTRPLDDIVEPLAETTKPDPVQPATAKVPRVNSARFNLNYLVDDVGPTGVQDVTLYITEDDGEKWYTYGKDQDRQSPIVVEVPGDGTYGFALRVQSGAGLAADPPQPGDAPEMSVVVDRQPPEAELLPIQQTGAARTPIRIQWRVADEALADRPVALYYAPQPSGPWKPITGWTENTGEFSWTTGENTPKRTYIRLEARDAAGNLTRVDSETPLVMNQALPTARIMGVESIRPE